MVATLRGFLRDNSAATAIEYAMIVALVGVAVMSGAQSIGVSLSTLFSNEVQECFKANGQIDKKCKH